MPRTAALSSAALSPPEMQQHSGPARVFNSEEEAIAAIYAGKIVPGDVVVIRYEGPKGGPGMREMLNPTSALAGMKLDKTVALITDGRFSGASRGAAIDTSAPRQPPAAPSVWSGKGTPSRSTFRMRPSTWPSADDELAARKAACCARAHKAPNIAARIAQQRLCKGSERVIQRLHLLRQSALLRGKHKRRSLRAI